MPFEEGEFMPASGFLVQRRAYGKGIAPRGERGSKHTFGSMLTAPQWRSQTASAD
jgi:hypothetical protein